MDLGFIVVVLKKNKHCEQGIFTICYYIVVFEFKMSFVHNYDQLTCLYKIVNNSIIGKGHDE